MANQDRDYEALQNLDQNSIFEDNTVPKAEKDAEAAKEVDEDSSSAAPSTYVRIDLDSVGKLSAPATLHFRNYSMEEVIELASITAENQNEVIVRVLNNLVWEDFDCSSLHYKEVEQILLSIHARWWSNTIESMPYYKNTSLPADERRDRSNIGYAVLPIQNIKTKPIDEGFSEPIEVKDSDGKKYGFTLPRMSTYITTKKFLKRKYKAQDRYFSDFKAVLRKEQRNPGSQDIDPDMEEEYEEYEANKRKDYLRVQQALQIYSVHGKLMGDSLEQKIYALQNSIPADAWRAYRSVEKHSTFGVQPDVTFYDEQSEDHLTRRFSFRLLDFIPTLEP